MVALLMALCLRRLRREAPELFDGVLAGAQISALLAEDSSAPCCALPHPLAAPFLTRKE